MPVIVARDLKARRDYVGDGLDTKILETDGKLHAIYAGSKVRFVSVTDKLCRGNVCRAKVPSYGGFDLLALDYGHLTPAGSDFVAQQVLPDLLVPPDLQRMASAR